MRIAVPSKKTLIAGALALGTVGSLAMGLVTSAPAHAQITVFDPTNYSQTLLTAARALQQINNQIQALQNQAQMLRNMEKNLDRIDFPHLQQMTETLQQVDRLMAQARGISFRVDQIDQQYRQLFPGTFDAALKRDDRVVAARSRLDASMDAYRQAMEIQAQVVTNVQGDAETLSALVGKSQGAQGSLQAQQATNQLLALTAKQQFQIQNMMAAQYRAQATEEARRAQAEIDGRASTRKFLGSGTAYTPQ